MEETISSVVLVNAMASLAASYSSVTGSLQKHDVCVHGLQAEHHMALLSLLVHALLFPCLVLLLTHVLLVISLMLNHIVMMQAESRHCKQCLANRLCLLLWATLKLCTCTTCRDIAHAISRVSARLWKEDSLQKRMLGDPVLRK